MAIEEEQTVVLASVDVNDEYRVELAQVRKVTDYSPDQAMALASELINAANDSRRMQRDQAGREAWLAPTAPSGEAVL